MISLNIQPVAICAGKTVIYWSGLIIALGTLSGFLLSNAIYTAHHRNRAAMWVMLPFSVVFSIVLCRMLHWYCHTEQYASFFSAVTDYSSGGYCIQGILPGVWFGALMSKGFGFTDRTEKLLDAAAPGLALTIAFIRLSSLFNDSCRSKYSIEKTALKKLPFGAPLSSSAQDWRFATFFVEFMFMMLAMVLLFFAFYHMHNSRMKRPCHRSGHIFRLFLLLFSMAELVLDSTRNDSSFMRFPGTLKLLNKFAGFVSVAQLVAAITMLAVMLYYSKRSIKANGHKKYHILLWLGYFVSLALVGGSEYAVQRWSNYHNVLYIPMTLGAITMAAVIFAMYFTCVEQKMRFEDDY